MAVADGDHEGWGPSTGIGVEQRDDEQASDIDGQKGGGKNPTDDMEIQGAEQATRRGFDGADRRNQDMDEHFRRYRFFSL